MKKGISLIALVITIVVLIILVSTVVRIAGRDDGILGITNKTVNANNVQVAQEKVIIEMGNYKVFALEKGENVYEYLTTDEDAAANLQKLKDKGFDDVIVENNQIICKLFGQTVPLDVNGTIAYKPYVIGDKFSVNGEEFYVIKDSSASEATVIGIAKLNINRGCTKQVNEVGSNTSVRFATANYWQKENFTGIQHLDLNNYSDIKDDKNSAINRANIYATQASIGAESGRLLTYEEVNNLSSMIPNIIGGTDNTANGCLYYWTSSAYDKDLVWRVYGTNGLVVSSFADGNDYGVRPVITIYKSKILS